LDSAKQGRVRRAASTGDPREAPEIARGGGVCVLNLGTLYDRVGVPLEVVVLPDQRPPVVLWGGRVFVLRDGGLAVGDRWRYIEADSLQAYRPEEWDKMRQDDIPGPGEIGW